MPKTMGDSVGGESKYFKNGVFVDKVTIASIKDISNYPLKPKQVKNTIGQNNFEPELCLEIVVDTGSFEKKMVLFGYFDWKKDSVAGNKYKGWKRGGNSVQSFLARLSPNEKFTLNDDDTIPEKLLLNLVGKEFFKLRYCVGSYTKDGEEKPSFQDYKKIQLYDEAEENADKLYSEFKKSLGWIKDYDPFYYDKWSKATMDNDTFDPSEFSNDDKDEDVI